MNVTPGHQQNSPSTEHVFITLIPGFVFLFVKYKAPWCILLLSSKSHVSSVFCIFSHVFMHPSSAIEELLNDKVPLPDRLSRDWYN